MDSQNTVKLPVKYHTKNATTDVIFNQPIVCPSDQQAGHATRRPTIASKNSSQGLSQQLPNLQIRRVFKRNTLMEETPSKLNSTQKIVVNSLQQLVTTNRVPATQPLYSLPDPNWLQSHLTQSIQLCVDSGAGRQEVSTNMSSTDRLQSLQITRPVYRLYSLIFTKTSYRVITSTTGYRAYRQGTGYTALLHQNRFQSLPT